MRRRRIRRKCTIFRLSTERFSNRFSYCRLTWRKLPYYHEYNYVPNDYLTSTSKGRGRSPTLLIPLDECRPRVSVRCCFSPTIPKIRILLFMTDHITFHAQVNPINFKIHECRPRVPLDECRPRVSLDECRSWAKVDDIHR